MRLTRQTNYAVRILMFCASSEKLSRIGQIAAFYDISELFLFKVLQTLTKGGYVESVRGRNGGIRLARPASEINLGAVVRSVEENFDLAECFEQGGAVCPLLSTCGMNEALAEALEAFFKVLDQYSIADLANNSRNIRILAQLDAMKAEPLNAV